MTTKLDKTVKIRLNKIVIVKPTMPMELALAYKFENFLFFCLHFVKALTIALQLKKVSNKCLKANIMLKIE